MSDTPLPTLSACPACCAGVMPGDLNCSHCHQLIHSERLKQLAADAENFSRAGDNSQALTCWREALELLPPESRQYTIISDKVAALSSQELQPAAAGATPAATAGSLGGGKKEKSKLGPLGAIGAALVFLLSKAKFLLLGLSKATTLLTMLLAFGVYWQLWGWSFAAGFVLSIYVHEMGHVAALRKFGIAATAPMFIPGVGAFVRLKQYPASPSEDAYVGLAGPLWGLGAACATGLVYIWTDSPLFAALTHTGAFINLFNLIPFGPLDGGRGFRALSKPQRFFAAAVVGASWYFTTEGMLLIILVVAGLCAFSNEAPKKNDPAALLKYVLLIASLSALVYWTAGVTVPRP